MKITVHRSRRPQRRPPSARCCARRRHTIAAPRTLPLATARARRRPVDAPPPSPDARRGTIGSHAHRQRPRERADPVPTARACRPRSRERPIPPGFPVALPPLPRIVPAASAKSEVIC